MVGAWRGSCGLVTAWAIFVAARNAEASAFARRSMAIGQDCRMDGDGNACGGEELTASWGMKPHASFDASWDGDGAAHSIVRVDIPPQSRYRMDENAAEAFIARKSDRPASLQCRHGG